MSGTERVTIFLGGRDAYDGKPFDIAPEVLQVNGIFA